MPSARCRIPKAAIPALVLLALTLGAQAQYVLDSIDVGGRFVGSMCSNPREDLVYGLSNTDNLVFAIDCSSSQVVAQVAAYYPRCIAYDSADDKLYCTFGFGDESLMVIDGTTHQPVRRMGLSCATLMAWDPTDSRLFVSRTEADRVSVIDCTTDSVIAHVTVGRGPLKMHLNSRHRKLYVQNHDAASVSIVDLGSLRVRATIPIGVNPRTGLYVPEADKYYCDGPGSVVVICGAGDTVVTQIPLGSGANAWSMCGQSGGHLLHIGAENGVGYTRLLTVDTREDTVMSRLTMPRGPQAMMVSPQTGLLYCALFDGAVAVVSGDGTRLLDTLPVHSSPFVLEYSAPLGRIYVGHLNSRWVFVIRDTLTGIEEHSERGRPQCPLLVVRPNPFRRQTRVATGLLGHVPDGLEVRSCDGRLVARLAVADKKGGSAQYRWDGSDLDGCEAPAGIYLIAPAGRPGLSVQVVKTEG